MQTSPISLVEAPHLIIVYHTLLLHTTLHCTCSLTCTTLRWCYVVQRFMKEDRLPHLLFYGPPGTGKTSTILACAKTLYKPREFSSMVLELNASDDRGIGIVRGKIMNFASTRTIFRSGFKLIILDEADAMTNDAQNALRRGTCIWADFLLYTL